MSTRLLATCVRQSFRNMHKGGVWFLFATTMCTLGMFALSVFLTVVMNFKQVADEMGESIGAVAFLNVDTPAQAHGVQQRMQRMPGVQRAQLVTPEQAKARMAKALPPEAAGAVIDVDMPYVIDISFTVANTQETPTSINTLAAMAQIPGVDEVMHPGGELEKVRALGKVLVGGASFLGVVIALVTIVVISNTVRLTLFARREEIGIMKLVGAADWYVRVPFLIEGAVQGVVGAAIALVLCYGAHASFAGWVQLALSTTLGAFDVARLPFDVAGALLLSGGVLGFLGAALSIGRFLRV